ncbi:hypothetical protein FISHEDRAFT_37161, partial [Fistulina hepatica ATCC 64428]
LPPLNDSNLWFYPSHGVDDENAPDINPGAPMGNWGCKNLKGARWVRSGKMAAWGPDLEDEEAQRSRKRLKMMLPPPPRSPSPPILPHLERSPSPALIAPHVPPMTDHTTYTAFIMDKSVTHTFRSKLLEELENVTNGLIQGEATMKRALGKLWEAVRAAHDRRSPDDTPEALTFITKQEDDMQTDDDDKARRLARAPDLSPAVQKIFLPKNNRTAPQPFAEPNQYMIPRQPQDILDKSLVTLRELQDDGREYIERLQEIREYLGEIKAQRDVVWTHIRSRALSEMQNAAISAHDDLVA